MPDGDAMKKLVSGDRLKAIPSQWFNRVTDATTRDERNKALAKLGALAVNRHEGKILIQNNSGEDRERFDVLGIDDILISASDNLKEFQNNTALKGVTPTLANHLGFIVIAAEPIPKDKIGHAFIFGCCPAYIDVQSETDEFADVSDGDATQLQSGGSGCAQILWAEGGTGPQWAFVRLGNFLNSVLCAKLTSKSGTLYAWSEAQTDSTTGAWAIKTGGLSGTTSSQPAVDLNSSDTGDLTNSFVILVSTVGSDGAPCWVIAGGAPSTGSTADLTLVSAVGWDGTNLTQTTEILHFVNGKFTGTSAGSTTTIVTSTNCPPD